VIYVWHLAGTTDFTPAASCRQAGQRGSGGLLALFMFGIGKAALMPFHRWLPAAMVAPTPVSALLHAVAVVKAGVFSVVKVIVYVFGLDSSPAPPTGWWPSPASPSSPPRWSRCMPTTSSAGWPIPRSASCPT
jgi:multicomponent Na+:H+ antiporter subunit D